MTVTSSHMLYIYVNLLGDAVQSAHLLRKLEQFKHELDVHSEFDFLGHEWEANRYVGTFFYVYQCDGDPRECVEDIMHRYGLEECGYVFQPRG